MCIVIQPLPGQVLHVVVDPAAAIAPRQPAAIPGTTASAGDPVLPAAAAAGPAPASLNPPRTTTAAAHLAATAALRGRFGALPVGRASPYAGVRVWHARDATQHTVVAAGNRPGFFTLEHANGTISEGDGRDFGLLNGMLLSCFWAGPPPAGAHVAGRAANPAGGLTDQFGVPTGPQTLAERRLAGEVGPPLARVAAGPPFYLARGAALQPPTQQVPHVSDPAGPGSLQAQPAAAPAVSRSRSREPRSD